MRLAPSSLYVQRDPLMHMLRIHRVGVPWPIGVSADFAWIDAVGG